MIQLCNHQAILSSSPLEVYLLLGKEKKKTSVLQDIFTYAIWDHVSLKSLSDWFQFGFYSKKIQLFFVLLQHTVIYTQPIWICPVLLASVYSTLT